MVSAAAPAAVPPRAGSPTSSTPYGVSSSAAATAGSRSGAPPRPACRVATQARAAAVRAGSAGGASSAETRRHAAYRIARASARTATRGVRKTVSPGTGSAGSASEATTTTGRPASSAAAAAAPRSATGSPSVVGTSVTTAASTSPDSSTSRTAACTDAGDTSAPRSTGLAAPTRGSTSRSRSCRSDDSTGTESPSPSAIPAVITPIPPALLSTPIRNPPGSGCWVSTAAVSAMSAPPRHGITPACANRAETPTLPPTEPSRDHGEQRLALGEPASGPRELQRVAERLEVQRRDRHRLVLAPRGQQVVAGHVELGPQRGERVHADPLAARQVEDGEPDPAGLGGHGQPARPRQRTGEGRVERTVGAEGDDALRVRPDQPHAVRATERQEVAAGGRLAASGQPRRHHHGRAHARGAGVGHHVRHLVGRHDHDDEVDGVRHRGDRGVRRHAVHRVGLGVHDAEPAGVPARPDRVEDGPAQPAAVTTYADHGDARGRQQRPQRAGLRAPLAPVGGVERRGRHVGAQLDGDLAVGGPPRDREPGPAEHAQHAVVVTQHLGLEAGQPVRATQGGEVLEQQDAEPAAVVLVGHQERDLRALAVRHLGGGEPGDPAADHRDHRGRVGVGLVEEVLDVAPGGVAAGGEEAQPQGVLGDTGVQVEERLAVLGPQGTDHGDRPVGQQHVGGRHRPLAWWDRRDRTHPAILTVAARRGSSGDTPLG